MEVLSIEYNIYYRAYVGSLVYILSTRGDLCFSVHKLAKRSSNPSKVQFEGLIHLLRYIRDNKNLGLKYYSKIENAPLSDLLRKVRINTDNQFMVLYILQLELLYRYRQKYRKLYIVLSRCNNWSLHTCSRYSCSIYYWKLLQFSMHFSNVSSTLHDDK